jgi:hypothetical protein
MKRTMATKYAPSMIWAMATLFIIVSPCPL